MSLPDIDSIPPGSTVPLDQLSSMFATLSTNDGFDLGKLSGLMNQESTQNNNNPTTVVVAPTPTGNGGGNNDGGIGPSQSYVDNQGGFESSLQALLGSSVTLDLGGTATGGGNSPAATITTPAITASSGNGNGGGGGGAQFTLPTFTPVTLSDAPTAPSYTGGFNLGNLFNGLFGTKSIAVPQSWSELFVQTVDWNTLYNGSPGTIDTDGNIIPMPTDLPTGSDAPKPVVTGSVITMVASAITTATGASSTGGGLLGWVGGLFGGGEDGATTTIPINSVVTATAVVTFETCVPDIPCSTGNVVNSMTTVAPPVASTGPTGPSGPDQANTGARLELVVPLLVAPLIALL